MAIKKPRKIDLGVFMAGEIPFPQPHIFKQKQEDGSKAAIDISSYTLLRVDVTVPDGATGVGAGGYALTTDGTDGSVTYTFVSADMQTAGQYELIMWIQNAPTDPTVRLSSDLIVWTVHDGPGDTPPA
jgi:hypothetical protein